MSELLTDTRKYIEQAERTNVESLRHFLLTGSEPIYAVYYINMVEQEEYMVDEVEEDQLDDNDGES